MNKQRLQMREQISAIMSGACYTGIEPDGGKIQKLAAAMREDIEASAARVTGALKAILPKTARIRMDSMSEVACQHTQKGVLMIGGVGCGKTVALKILGKLSNSSPKYIAVPELALGFATDGMEYIKDNITACRGWHMIFDDIGAEQKTKSFGTVLPIEEIIMHRYLLWQESRVLTHFATNLDGAEIERLYGERVLDRMKEMCDVVIVDGGSLRGKVR